ncbi:hypothetical protein Acsp03_08330 [Actinomadura sp. NBRC 104412]|uniref:DUF3152 domain-containing protein n=1 Tax=Actinomadura sp. NBRC 104412 TaxID=3032203 RepID=UPI00249FD50B|nr:DUF3152 domain-containing protein [Actinomadura sp. NBRC 104412]GLZ03366.1 hypothetical protein Acsp03_08330 [Actinomadura sp. NBRC 104412]
MRRLPGGAVTVVVAAVTVVAGAGLVMWGQTGTAGDAVARGGARTHAHLAHPGGASAGSGAGDVRSGQDADAAARAGARAGAARAGVVNGRRQPPRVPVPWSASGRYLVVPGSAQAPPGPGRVVRYAVEVERGLPFAAAAFAAQVHRVLNDPRGWGRGGAMRFTRVSRGPVRFRVALSSPAMTERMCLPLRTDGLLSCHSHGRSVINARRWGQGARPYGADLAAYREYLINHEVGHALGHGHRYCPGRGRRAPVMVQQTKSLYGCRPNPWPFPHP